ncbi:MAG: septum formation initiator family protein [Actinomycetes bacterium]
MALLAGLTVLLGFYASAGIRMWTAHADSVQRRSYVIKLQNERDALLRQRKALGGQLGIATQARRLGMVMPGEVPFVITGLPGETH